ncbi:MAG: YtxH domain-containing protein [Holophaga sp.]|nr:YtxH domain-containing protein [Holophaga sp.]
MSQEKMSSGNLAVLSFVGGALLGALVVALTTPKAGPEVREELKAFGRRAKGKVGQLGDQAETFLGEAKARADQSVADLRRGVQEAADDFKRGLHEASLDLKRSMQEAATDLQVGIASPAARSTETNNTVPLT